MPFDINSSGLDFSLTGLASNAQLDSPTAASSEAPLPGSTLGADVIASSPLTYFGGVVEQIGQAMMQSKTGGDAANGDMSKAIELLEGVIGLMSGVGESGSPDQTLQNLSYIPLE